MTGEVKSELSRDLARVLDISLVSNPVEARLACSNLEKGLENHWGEGQPEVSVVVGGASLPCCVTPEYEFATSRPSRGPTKRCHALLPHHTPKGQTRPPHPHMTP